MATNNSKSDRIEDLRTINLKDPLLTIMLCAHLLLFWLHDSEISILVKTGFITKNHNWHHKESREQATVFTRIFIEGVMGDAYIIQQKHRVMCDYK